MVVETRLYDILSIPPSAQQVDIKKAYHKAARTWHPDKNKNNLATEYFKQVSQAYEILSNSEKRTIYDRHGLAFVLSGGRMPPKPSAPVPVPVPVPTPRSTPLMVPRPIPPQRPHPSRPAVPLSRPPPSRPQPQPVPQAAGWNHHASASRPDSNSLSRGCSGCCCGRRGNGMPSGSPAFTMPGSRGHSGRYSMANGAGNGRRRFDLDDANEVFKHFMGSQSQGTKSRSDDSYANNHDGSSYDRVYRAFVNG